MHRFLLALACILAWSVGATPFSCNPLLDQTVIPRVTLPRIDKNRSAEADAETLLRSGAILTRDGRDELFVIDALAARPWAEKFVDSLIEDPTTGFARAWRQELTLRIAAYADFGTKLDALEAAVHERDVTEGVRDAFFTRSFAYRGRRVMLVSLRAPSLAPTVRAPSIKKLSPADLRARHAPAGAWFALPPVDGRPRFTFWDVDGVPAPSHARTLTVVDAKLTARAFEKSLLIVADHKRRMTGADVVRIPFYSLQFMNTDKDPGAMLFEARYEEHDGHEALRIVRQYDASPADVVVDSAEFVREHLEPSQRTNPGPNRPDVFVPTAVWHTEIDQSMSQDAIERALGEAFEFDPNLAQKLGEMPVNGRLVFATPPALKVPGSRKRRSLAPFTMILTKADDGRVYLLSWIRSIEI